MKRSLRLAPLVGMFACAMVIAAVGRADEPATKIRLWHVGNSWSCPFPFEKVGRFERPFILPTHRFNDGRGPNWVDHALESDKKQILAKGDFDVVYLGFVQLSQPVESLDRMADLAVKHKPDCRIYLQHAWASGGMGWGPTGLRDEDDLAMIDAEWAKRRKKLEDKTDEINTRLGKRVVFISPVADAVMRMRQMVVAGTLPGVTKQSQLFYDPDDPPRRDDHGAGHIGALTVYCAHAAIYRKSPEGLAVPADGSVNRTGKPPVTEAAHAAMQKLAWEVVSAYPYSGVPAADASKPAATAPAPTP